MQATACIFFVLYMIKLLPFGKLIVYNNQLYFGNNSNQPTAIQADVDLSSYVTNTSLNSTLNGYAKTSELPVIGFGRSSSTINLGFQASVVVCYTRDDVEPQQSDCVMAILSYNNSNIAFNFYSSYITVNNTNLITSTGFSCDALYWSSTKNIMYIAYR